MSIKRVFLIVLDSVGIGHAPDAKDYGDEGSNTLLSCSRQSEFFCPTLKRLGIFNINKNDYLSPCANPLGAYGRFEEKSKGKDTTTGHWEICGIISKSAMPTYPNGFPKEIIDEFEKQTGRKVICNKPYSGTKVIADYGNEHLKTGALIVYTSADSVFQIAAHESIVPRQELYQYCKTARKILCGKNAVGRVIARPFAGKYPFERTSGWHDFSLQPPQDTLLDVLCKNGLDIIPIGKIYDIFAGRGLKEPIPTVSNQDGMKHTDEAAKQDFHGLCFVNLVDFDMLYGHRNDPHGYAQALSEFDKWLGEFLKKLKSDDILMITADHGCDPLTPSTDHSRECVPLLVCGKSVKPVDLGTRKTYADIGKTVADIFGVPNELSGTSFKDEILYD